MSDESLSPQPAQPRPPTCERCLTRESVVPVNVVGLFDGIEYWQCLACNRVFGTRYGRPAKESWA
jgi:hypothetical protein